MKKLVNHAITASTLSMLVMFSSSAAAAAAVGAQGNVYVSGTVTNGGCLVTGLQHTVAFGSIERAAILNRNSPDKEIELKLENCDTKKISVKFIPTHGETAQVDGESLFALDSSVNGAAENIGLKIRRINGRAHVGTSAGNPIAGASLAVDTISTNSVVSYKYILSLHATDTDHTRVKSGVVSATIPFEVLYN